MRLTVLIVCTMACVGCGGPTADDTLLELSKGVYRQEQLAHANNTLAGSQYHQL